MRLLDHLRELRGRLIKSLIALGLGMLLALFVIEPYAFELALRPLGNRELLYLGLGEAFSIHLTLSFYLGIVLAIPVIAYQAWAFIEPGLRAGEKKLAMKLATLSSLLFVAGAAFGYFLLLPAVIEFFLSFEAGGLRYGGALEPYLSLVAGIVIGAGIAFQLPLLLLALMKTGLVTRKSMAEKRRYWFLGIVIAGAALTPTGDAATLAVFCVPLWLLFEMTLLIARAGETASP